MIRILHITDFHISKPREPDEVLAADGAAEYLKSLSNCVRDCTGDDSINVIVATGDFVDRGSIGNFEYAQSLLSNLGGMLKVSSKDIATCIGNHDFLRALDAKNDRGARKDYREYIESHFGNAAPLKQTDRAIFFRTSSKVACLMLDATWGCAGGDTPGNLLDDEIEEIMRWIKYDVSQEELLVVGSHYPTFDFPDALISIVDNEPRWQERHLWSAGKLLAHRLTEWRRGVKTIWLCGDTHAPDQILSRDILTVMTGRIGTRSGSSELRQQARIIEISSAVSTPRLFTLNYEPPAHKQRKNYGVWNCVETVIRHIAPVPFSQSDVALTSAGAGNYSFQPPAKAASPPVDVIPPASPSSATGWSHESVVPTDHSTAMVLSARIAKPQLPITCVSHEIERKILDAIESERLYRIGRFCTSDTVASLSWVSIGPLLAIPGLLPSTVDALAGWLSGQLQLKAGGAAEGIVLVGVDCWGTVLATQIAVLLGAPSICVAGRGDGKHHTALERVDGRVGSTVKDASVIVLVMDVIATGHGLARICSHLSRELQTLGVSPAGKRWIALSVICDDKKSLPHCDFLSSLGTACGSLRMPLVATAELPPEGILPTTLSFV